MQERSCKTRSMMSSQLEVEDSLEGEDDPLSRAADERRAVDDSA